MPLHLLGKKSWNVYNAVNIEKVKRDEAAAAAREAAEERRMQEADAERRIQLLRGLPVEPLPAPDDDEDGRHERRRESGGERKRRRVHGEDDTERDIRCARESRALGPRDRDEGAGRRKTSDAPLTDPRGHISLFPEEVPGRSKAKNPEAEREAAKERKEFGDQYTMRFSNAAGFGKAVDGRPWYHPGAAPCGGEGAETVTKDVWGNDDPRRKERDRTRTAADDPLAAMKKGVQGLREAEKERGRWKAEKERETRELAAEAERRAARRRARKRRGDDEDELEGFNLDDDAGAEEEMERRQRQHRRKHRRSSRSPARHGSSHHVRGNGNDAAAWAAAPGGRYSQQFMERDELKALN